MKTAIKVLFGLGTQILDQTIRQEEKFLIYPYLNGREKGFAIVVYPENPRDFFDMHSKTVVFAEYRSSDELVVYVGREKDFENAGRLNCQYIPKQETYNKRKTFRVEDIMTEGIEFIRKELGLDHGV